MKIEAGFNEEDGLFITLEPSNSEEYWEMEKLVGRIGTLGAEYDTYGKQPYIKNRIATIPLFVDAENDEDF